MAPRRNNSGPSVLDVQNLFGLDQSHLDGTQDSVTDLTEPNMVRCCIPNTECLKTSDFGLINLDDLSGCVRVTCNNETCTAGNYMHRECFDAWEQTVLIYLKSVGRARSWSDKQRQQNLWTKKGYDLVYKACTCKCGRGHLKKDLDWTAPQSSSGFNRGTGVNDDEANKKKKKRNRNNQKPTLSLGNNNTQTVNGFHPNCQTNNKMNGLDLSLLDTGTNIRGRANSLSSSNGSSSPPVSSSEQSISPVHNINNAGTNNGNNNNNNNNNSITKNNNIIKNHSQEIQRPLTPRTLTEIYSDRVR